jgi:hypothetical protein
VSHLKIRTMLRYLAQDSSPGSPIERTDAGQKLRDVSHAAEIRGDDDIGDDEQRTSAP